MLAAHEAAEPIMIQCIAGKGVICVGEKGETIELRPGVLLTLEPNVTHEVEALPAGSIPLTRFTELPACRFFSATCVETRHRCCQLDRLDRFRNMLLVARLKRLLRILVAGVCRHRYRRDASAAFRLTRP
jgi:hypothetical protein